jgi:hypothetical protein
LLYSNWFSIVKRKLKKWFGMFSNLEKVKDYNHWICIKRSMRLWRFGRVFSTIQGSESKSYVEALLLSFLTKLS